MSNVKLPCPYCSESVYSGKYLSHLLITHFDALFDPTTEKGKLNRKSLEIAPSTKPFHFALPNRQENFCCFHCCISCVKNGSALKHFERAECREGHLAKLNEYRSRLESGEESTETPQVISTDLSTNLDVLSIIHQFMVHIDCLEEQNRRMNKMIGILQEEGHDTHQCDCDEIDIEPMEEDPYKILDVVGRGLKLRITRKQCNDAFLKMRSSYIQRSTKRKAAPSNG